MFTGLVQQVGIVTQSADGQLLISARLKKPVKGESISVDGACLTLLGKKGRSFAFDIGPETRRITTLGDAKPGARVNLERSLKVGDTLGGHWVLGHVDGIGRIRRVREETNGVWVTIEVPTLLQRYMVSKGSVAVDGISLTVARVRPAEIDIMIVPHTWQNTTLADKRIGARVNLEADILAKYVQKGRS